MAKITVKILVSLIALSVGSLQAADHEPLLMAGKKTLYQRVLSMPDARIFETADSTAASAELVPFSVFYVYARQDGWVHVGSDSFGKVIGWIPEKQTIVWNQALTVSFKDPQDMQRVMLFDSKQALKQLADDFDKSTYQFLYQDAIQGEQSENSPVIALQPEAYRDIRDNFYLVPIKQHEDIYLGSEQARLLEIASVPLDDKDTHFRPKNQRDRNYRSGIHFVIDSTASMGPYIDRTREAVNKVFSTIDLQGLTNQVSFALTAYRDNIAQVPALEYLTRRYANLQQGADMVQFFKHVNQLSPAKASSQNFREDAYAGIKSAIEDSAWEDFDARYVVLITDAGPRESHDPLGETGLNARALRQFAYDKGVSIWVLHLRTPVAGADHERAENLYKELSFFPDIGDFYYGVSLGQVDEFGRVLEALANQITQQVLATTNGLPPIPLPDVTNGIEPTQLEKLQSRVDKLGHALRMRYVQKETGQPLPKIFSAWMIDRDFLNPERSSVDIRVLLTRDQLSDLKSVMQQVLDLAEEGVLSPKNFINDLKSLAATVSRDPASVGASTSDAGTNLAEMGYMREYIEDLPYTGEVMNLTLANWEEWSAKTQIEFIQRLDNKIHYYQALHDHTDLWVTLDGGPIDGNSVFPVVLDLLP